MNHQDALLEAYLLNLLDEQDIQMLEKELANSPELQNELLKVQETLDLFAYAENEIKPSANLYSRILNTISTDRSTLAIEHCVKIFDLSYKRINEILDSLNDLTQSIWQSTPIPGTQIHYFSGGPAASNLTCGLMIVKPGVIFPAHQHKGREWISVIQGSIIDNSGNQYHAGDFIVSQPGTWHSFKVNSKDSFVFAVALEKPHRWLVLRSLADIFFSKFRFR